MKADRDRGACVREVVGPPELKLGDRHHATHARVRDDPTFGDADAIRRRAAGAVSGDRQARPRFHSLGGGYYYDPKDNRMVAVHSAALVEALDKIYGAGRIVAELKH